MKWQHVVAAIRNEVIKPLVLGLSSVSPWDGNRMEARLSNDLSISIDASMKEADNARPGSTSRANYADFDVRWNKFQT